MAPLEEKKRKTKKLVIEETSVPVEDKTLQPQSESSIPKEEIKTEEVIEKPKEIKSVILPPEEVIEKPGEVSLSEENSETKDSKVSIFWVILLALFIIASLVGGGILVFRAGVEKGKLEVKGTLQETISPTEIPSPTPAVEVKREDFKIQVLNGTGQAGVAATAQQYLEGLGYKDVAVGNASASDFADTEISIKDSKKDFLETLKADLSKEYEVAATAKTLSSSSDFDAVITIGASTK